LTAIKIVVVTKGHPLEVQEAYAAGARILGKLPEDWQRLIAKLSGVGWHDRARAEQESSQVCQYFDTLHSLIV
jgi:hypothetical protein